MTLQPSQRKLTILRFKWRRCDDEYSLTNGSEFGVELLALEIFLSWSDADVSNVHKCLFITLRRSLCLCKDIFNFINQHH